MKTSAFILIGIFCLWGCKQKSEEEIRISQFKELFPNEMTSHVPELSTGKSLGMHLRYPDGCYAENFCGLHIVMQMTSDAYSEYKSYLDKNKKAVYHISDSCLKFINYKKGIFIETAQCDTLDEGHYPISNFNYCYEIIPEKSFFEKSTIYLLGAETGVYIDKENLTKGVGLSKKWENGYSKGALINDERKIVFVWLEVW